MPGVPLTHTQIVTKFNTLIKNLLNSPASTATGLATYHTGNRPPATFTTTDARLGNRAEPPKSPADFVAASGGATSDLTGTVVYNIMHAWAMELTRVRRVTFVYGVGNAVGGGNGPNNVQVIPGSAALKPAYALYFPIPVQPVVGATITETQFDNFLMQLRVRVQEIRTGLVGASAEYRTEIYACHSNCHSSCHSSRNRR